jgi:hypothetical protein
MKKVREMEKYFKGYTVQHIPRAENGEADKLSNSSESASTLDVFFEIITSPLVKEQEERMMNVIETVDWRAQIMAFLRNHYESTDET